MTFGTSKEGGDVAQINHATQGNVSTQSLNGAAVSGPAIVDSIGGTAFLTQAAEQVVEQSLEQFNFGVGGQGGSDNTQANTIIAA